MLLLDLLVFLNGLYIPYMPLSPPIQAATAATWTLRGGAITPHPAVHPGHFMTIQMSGQRPMGRAQANVMDRGSISAT